MISSWEELRREDVGLEDKASSASLEVLIDTVGSAIGSRMTAFCRCTTCSFAIVLIDAFAMVAFCVTAVVIDAFGGFGM
eukprot:scaffold44992_cov86-Cyclotella_meneghiniana.AAC.1